jgi:hypothetical protein
MVNLAKHRRADDTIRFNSIKQIIASTDSLVKCLGVLQRVVIHVSHYYELERGIVVRKPPHLYESSCERPHVLRARVVYGPRGNKMEIHM